MYGDEDSGPDCPSAESLDDSGSVKFKLETQPLTLPPPCHAQIKVASLKEEIRHEIEVMILIHFTSLKFLLCGDFEKAAQPLDCQGILVFILWTSTSNLTDLTGNILCKNPMALRIKVLTV
ncbi:hypothetical protein PoB_006253700 [Plakobranchus ocellatus]|uniref:Uncharacterized protein n=1 Tax=Plakobranchus ocellatus TaxID=259542 RepID=A0AAV4CVU8_9GAST|nr:hypothetical protein PoB_006253700 [Plakobranchus ocellatus]